MPDRFQITSTKEDKLWWSDQDYKVARIDFQEPDHSWVSRHGLHPRELNPNTIHIYRNGEALYCLRQARRASPTPAEVREANANQRALQSLTAFCPYSGAVFLLQKQAIGPPSFAATQSDREPLSAANIRKQRKEIQEQQAAEEKQKKEAEQARIDAEVATWIKQEQEEAKKRQEADRERERKWREAKDAEEEKLKKMKEQIMKDAHEKKCGASQKERHCQGLEEILEDCQKELRTIKEDMNRIRHHRQLEIPPTSGGH
ncbi:hypothetical protein LA080_009722 [Diaporthe eres]|nr:hypothetical protein LA080_009722 [Diaporthe eres]